MEGKRTMPVSPHPQSVTKDAKKKNEAGKEAAEIAGASDEPHVQ